MNASSFKRLAVCSQLTWQTLVKESACFIVFAKYLRTYMAYIKIILSCMFWEIYVLSGNICHEWGNGKQVIRLMMKHVIYVSTGSAHTFYNVYPNKKDYRLYI